jgi:hypothetical protein
MRHEFLMQSLESIVIKPHSAIVESLAFHPGDADDDPILQVYAIFAISFEIVTMVDLIDTLAVLQPSQH